MHRVEKRERMSSRSFWIGGGAAVALMGSLVLMGGRSARGQQGGGVTTSVSLAAAATASCACYLLATALGQVKVASRSPTMGIPVKVSSSNNKARRLGFLERWYVAHSRAGMHTGFVVGLELKQQQGINMNSMEQLKTRLTQVTSKFPWLRCKVHRDGVEGVDSRTSLSKLAGTPVANNDSTKTTATPAHWGDDLFVEEEQPYPLPALRQVDTGSECDFDERLRQVMQEESIQIWHDEDPTEDLWRVTLVKDDSNHKCALVLSFHHLIIDGVGALEVARAIVNPDSAPIDEQHLPPPMEDVMDVIPTVSHMLRLLFWYSFPKIDRFLHPEHWRGRTVHKDYPEPTDRATELVCCRNLLEDTDRLRRQFCQQHNLSLNAVLVATLTKAVAIVISTEPSVRFKIQLAADERRRRAKAVTAHQLGPYVTGPQLRMTVHKDCSIAVLGRDFTEKMQPAIASSAMDLGMCRFIDQDWIQFSRGLANEKPNGVHDSLEVSLLNDVDADFHGVDCAVKRLWFVQGRRGFGPGIIVTTINTGTCLNASLSAFPDAVSRDQLEKILAVWKEELLALLT